MNSTLTQRRLKQLLHYDPATGIFMWIVKPSKRVCVGDVAGSEHGDGYLHARVAERSYYMHRLAFLYMTGKWPQQRVDHWNGIRHDNRWKNLRDVTRNVNQQNMRRPMCNNKLGVLGVHMVKERFRAQILVNNRLIVVGMFDNLKEAGLAYVRAKRKHHEGCTI